MSNGTEMGDNPSEKMEVVRSSEVLFTEQQLIIQSLKQELEVNKKKNRRTSGLDTAPDSRF